MSEATMQSDQGKKPKKKRENILLNLAFNILIPAMLMTKKAAAIVGWKPELGLTVALAFPVIYGIYDFFARKKVNVISILGFVSILLTGGIGLLKLPAELIAYKEATIPLLIGILIVITASSKKPLVRMFIYNDEIMHVDKVNALLAEKGTKSEFESLMKSCTWILAVSFLVSAILNFCLAKWIIVSPSGTEEFNDELSRMHILSWPVIVIPCMGMTLWAVFKLLNGIRRLTGLEIDDVFAIDLPKEDSPSTK